MDYDLRLQSLVWLTWERQRRNAGLSGALGAQLLELDLRGGRLRRYARLIPRTWRLLREHRPRLVIVQNPSLVLTVEALLFGALARIPVVVDAHNAGIRPLDGKSRLFGMLAAALVRRSTLTIVTNEVLATVVRGWKGRAFVLPDAIPNLPGGRPYSRRSGHALVLAVGSFARDEPYEAVIEAARLLGPNVTIHMTGNPKGQLDRLLAMAPVNVRFTGFLPEEDYVGLLRASDIVLDLTTRDDCLVCGAYEAVAVGKAMVLSDTAVNRAYFSVGAMYTGSSAQAIAETIRDAVAARVRLEAEVRVLREHLVADWEWRIQELAQLLAALPGSSVAMEP
jgi:glycosyltransferase involved in cell wall biosynthesis